MKYTRAEFAKRLGKKSNYVGQYLERGKLVLEDGMIDDENEVNALFLARYEGNRVGVTVPTAEVAKPAAPKKAAAAEKKSGKINRPPVPGKLPDSVKAALRLERQTKEAELQKKLEEVELLKLKKQKLEGLLIPTEVVKTLFALHFKSMYVAFENAAESLFSDVAQKYAMSSADVAGFRGKLVASINAAVREGVERSRKEVESIVNEYSQTRGRGERK